MVCINPLLYLNMICLIIKPQTRFNFPFFTSIYVMLRESDPYI